MSTDRTKLLSTQTPSYSGVAPRYQRLDETGLTHAHSLKSASSWLFIIQGVLIVIFAILAKETYLEGDKFIDTYQLFTGVEIMMFIGFGYLMTFLKRYGMGAVGFTMLITVVGLQWGIVTEALAAQWFRGVSEKIPVNITTMVTGLDLVAALLISFGGVIGKASPLQLVIMIVFECVFYAINKSIFLAGYLDFIDAGGSIQIHMFGAYFGLAVAYLLGNPSKGAENETNDVSNTFSLIGTIFLWIYWPSFNGGELAPNSHAQQRAVVGTILSLCAATVGTFFASSYFNPNHKFRPVDIQNATLAGGVAIGAVCNLTLSLSDCLLIGFIAGIVSSLGFAYFQPQLESAGVHDTCGIHNLHGLPSLVGGLASVVLCFYKAPLGHDMPAIFHNANQSSLQLMSIFATLFFAIFTGVVTGWFMNLAAPVSSTEPFSDLPYWDGDAAETDEELPAPQSAVRMNLEAPAPAPAPARMSSPVRSPSPAQRAPSPVHTHTHSHGYHHGHDHHFRGNVEMTHGKNSVYH